MSMLQKSLMSSQIAITNVAYVQYNITCFAFICPTLIICSRVTFITAKGQWVFTLRLFIIINGIVNVFKTSSLRDTILIHGIII